MTTAIVIIDDSDLSIQYSGVTVELDPGTLDASYNGTHQSVGGTLHNTSRSDSSTFSYNFTGAATINMFAIMSTETVKNALEKQEWSCKINGKSTTPIALEMYPLAATHKICSGEGLPNTENVFSFSTTSSSPNRQDILFDYLEYVPSASLIPRNCNFIGVIANDANIHYQGGWINNTLSANNTAMVATGPGPLAMQFAFNGTSLTLLVQKILTGDMAEKVANVSFSIDKDTPTIVHLQPLKISTTGPLSPIVSNEIVFQRHSLDPTTPHTLNVAYLGQSSNAMPLNVQSFVVGIESSINATGPTSSIDPNPGPAVSRDHQRIDVRPIVGSVAAVSLFVLCIVVALIWRARLRKRTLQHLTEASTATVEPFIAHHVTMIQTLLEYPNSFGGPAIKARRRLLLANRGNLVIPPTKHRAIITGDNVPEESPEEISEPRHENMDEAVGAIADSEGRPNAIQAADSGLRNVEEQISRVSTLPPAYTPA